MIQLIAEAGYLHLDTDTSLLYVYPTGDCDMIEWPDFNPEHLRAALYDEFEQGNLSERTVLLPDGRQFHIDPQPE